MTSVVFFFNDTATTEIYTLSLHDALPIFVVADLKIARGLDYYTGSVYETLMVGHEQLGSVASGGRRSEEHTSELQSRQYLVCRLLLEKKNNRAKDPMMCGYATPDPSDRLS